jgi:hypothetical protein
MFSMKKARYVGRIWFLSITAEDEWYDLDLKTYHILAVLIIFSMVRKTSKRQFQDKLELGVRVKGSSGVCFSCSTMDEIKV